MSLTPSRRPVFPALVGIAASACVVYAWAQAQPADPTRSQLSFVSKQMGVPVNGKFGQFSASVDWNAAKPDASRAQMEIDMASIDAGSQEANDEVKGKNWFDIKQFPKASFTSTAVKTVGAGKYEVTGKMSIKGRARDVTAPFSVKTEGATTVFEGAFPIKRLQWGIGEGPWADPDTVGDDVQIKFRIVTAAKK